MNKAVLDRAFKLLDEYNNPETKQHRIDAIVIQLYNLGYVIRPNNAGNWCLEDRHTRVPVIR